ncbi:MAG: M20 family metallopeptidase [Eubacteriales bacterium]|nr:M20 family metallopeptidase [Eubacteriales bacterium]
MVNFVELNQLIKEAEKWAVSLRHDFHRWPELGNNEFRTSERIRSELDLMNIKNEKMLRTGVVGLLENQKGRIIALRADMDGLPVQEAVSLPFASERKGIMHACGHDVHMAVLLGAAMVLNKIKNQINGSVKFIFQPAEETTGGAKRMIKKGCLEPKTDYILGLHVKPDLPAGTIGIKYGKVHASSDTFQITVKGKTSHGAYPELGIDSLTASAQIVTGVQSIIARNISALNSAVITIGSIHGGNAVNLIADTVILEGTIRSLDYHSRELLKTRLKEMAHWTAQAYGAKAEVKFQKGYPVLVNDNLIVDIIKNTAICETAVEKVVELKDPTMGVEDFSYYLERVSGAFFFLGSGYKGKENEGIHSERFEVDERCIGIGIELYVMSVLKLLE